MDFFYWMLAQLGGGTAFTYEVPKLNWGPREHQGFKASLDVRSENHWDDMNNGLTSQRISICGTGFYKRSFLFINRKGVARIPKIESFFVSWEITARHTLLNYQWVCIYFHIVFEKKKYFSWNLASCRVWEFIYFSFLKLKFWLRISNLPWLYRCSKCLKPRNWKSHLINDKEIFYDHPIPYNARKAHDMKNTTCQI